MQGNINTTQRDPLESRRDADLRQLMKAVTDLKELIDNTAVIWGTGGKCMLDKHFVSEQLELVVRLLPDTVKQAASIVHDSQNIRENARREAAEVNSKARTEAQSIVDAANKEAEAIRADVRKMQDDSTKATVNANNAASTLKAQAEKDAAAIRQSATDAGNALYTKAQQDASAIINGARQQAGIIIADANSQAENAVSEQNVYRMAVMKAKELRESTEDEMSIMRQRYAGGLCSTMEEVEAYLMSLVSSIRAERQNLINKQ